MSIADFKELMPATVTLQSATGSNEYGVPTLGAAQSFAARVVYKQKRVSAKSGGADVLSHGEVWLAGTPTLTERDKLTLPDGSSPVILNWEIPSDETGSHHTKVFFGAYGGGGARGTQ